MASISELSLEANSYSFSPQVSFPSWLHVCQTLLRESRIYDTEDQDLERAYVLYLRFADLVLNKLRTHPDFLKYKTQYARVYKELPRAIERSEQLKDRILARRELKRKAAPAQEAPKQHTLSLEEELDYYATVDDPQLQFDPTSLPRIAKSRPTAKPVLVDQPQYPALHLPQSPAGPLSVKPTAFPSKYSNERGEALRQVFVPKNLRSEFLRIAKPNTDANLETCAMLCGKLERNAFFVTDLVVPHQTSTSDTCATTNEEELFEYVDTRDLFLVGWIHTHPSQTCFMSSVDLHTHASYQLMLPEAVAIVCSPSHTPSWAAFRLTDPPGIPVIRACRKTEFHPHENQDSLYKSASNSGHYSEIDAKLVTKDLRK